MAVFGDTLRQARAYKGTTLKEAEQATRINRHHLAALEDENFAVLPPLIYQRGIVRNYAAYLDLDPGKLLPMFEEARGGASTSELVAAVKPLEMPNHWAPNFAIIAFLVVISAIVFAWTYSVFYPNIDATSTALPRVPTVTPIAAGMTGLPTVAAIAATPTSKASATADSDDGGIAASTSEATTAATATATASPTEPVPAATREPEPETEVERPVAAATQAVVQQQQPTDEGEVVAQVEEQEPTAPAVSGATASIRVIAVGDIEVTVVADDQTVFSGWLAADTATEYFTAARFTVSTSNGSLTQFQNPALGEEPFYMDATQGPITYSLAAPTE